MGRRAQRCTAATLDARVSRLCDGRRRCAPRVPASTLRRARFAGRASPLCLNPSPGSATIAPMSPSRTELLAAVCAAPDDDAPRLAYAAFCDEHEPPRAELIRQQIGRALEERRRRKMFSEPNTRELELLAAHGEAWTRDLQTYVVPDATMPLGCALERGFVEHARVTLANVMSLGARLYALAPIRHLDVVCPRGALADDRDARRVLRADGLEHLRSLSLAGLGIGDEGARELAGCASLAHVRWIDLSRNAIGRAGVEALARSALMADKLFVLDGNPCDPIERPSFDWDGSVADVTSPGFPSEIEAAVGHRVAWLRHSWARAGQKPDRFHA